MKAIKKIRDYLNWRSQNRISVSTQVYLMSNFGVIRWQSNRVALLAFLLVLTLSCERDILEGQPDWLGNSIYEQLQQEGNYTYTVRLIDDLGQTDVLRKTGSKTLFVASDEAFEEFFKDNDWGVSSYDDLSIAQKKLLFNSSMINNAYLVELLSSAEGDPPLEGKCMRRATAASVYDSVSRIMPDNMPNTDYWARYKGSTRGMLLLKDSCTKPMIHFLPVFMKTNNITDRDLQILTNGISNSTSDAWVNGKKIVERDITCKNGYIHKIDGLATAADNMAEIIASDSRMSLFSRMLNRYSAPIYSEGATADYARLYTSSDSVFILRYITDDVTVMDEKGNEVVPDATLSYDPGCNQFIYSNTSDIDFEQDAGAMLVPTDEAMNTWWNQEGKVLQDIYGTWDNVPLKVLVKLMNINMISSFIETVPSKFDNIVDNTTKLSIGIKEDDVEQCFMGCNGVVYMINKVFAPADYSSVSFPALVNDNLNVIYWALSELDFEPYLNSMDSKYSFFIPSNNAMLSYIDPCSYGKSVQILYEFYYDEDTKTVKAHRYNCDMYGNKQDQIDDATTSQISDRLEDLLDNIIVVGDVEDGSTYYKTKGGSMLKVSNAGVEGSMTVSGGLQISQGVSLSIDTIYEELNGKTYIIDNGIPLSSPKSVYATLKDIPEYSDFFNLLNGSSLLIQKLSSKYTCADYNISLFDVYNYTVYVPTNSSLQELHDRGILPSWEDYDNLATLFDFGSNSLTLKSAQTFVQDRINNFLRYHIQDNSIMIDGTPVSDQKYETFMINPDNNRFYSVSVSSNNQSLSVTDQLGNVRKATSPYNNICREIWIQGTSPSDEIYSASDIVVHNIDGVLFYNEDQLTDWRSEVQNIIDSAAQ